MYKISKISSKIHSGIQTEEVANFQQFQFVRQTQDRLDTWFVARFTCVHRHVHTHACRHAHTHTHTNTHTHCMWFQCLTGCHLALLLPVIVAWNLLECIVYECAHIYSTTSLLVLVWWSCSECKTFKSSIFELIPASTHGHTDTCMHAHTYTHTHTHTKAFAVSEADKAVLGLKDFVEDGSDGALWGIRREPYLRLWKITDGTLLLRSLWGQTAASWLVGKTQLTLFSTMQKMEHETECDLCLFLLTFYKTCMYLTIVAHFVPLFYLNDPFACLCVCVCVCV